LLADGAQPATFFLMGDRDLSNSHQLMELLATDPLLPVRIVAAIAFIAMICAYVYVLRHLRKIEKTIVAHNLVPSELGPRNNMVLMVCLIPLIATALVLYLIIKT
jgi:hypothetical protein